MAPSPQEVTRLLLAWRNGDQSALDKLMPLVYDELRRRAGRYMKRERIGHTLQPTALANEVFLKMVDQQHVEWQSRAHFFAIAARIMRHLLVDHARKRGRGARQVTLDEGAVISGEPDVNLLALDEALNRLAAFDPRKAHIVELRFFGGLTVEETAEVLGVSEITVKREWGRAKAWLYSELSQEK
jgi:RNA polymerase sigma factor (TIGR02999 family)